MSVQSTSPLSFAVSLVIFFFVGHFFVSYSLTIHITQKASTVDDHFYGLLRAQDKATQEQERDALLADLRGISAEYAKNGGSGTMFTGCLH